MTANGFHYDGRTFASAGAPETTGADGSVPRGHYHQTGDLVWGEISGGAVRVGSLAGTCGPDGTIRFAYCQVLVDGTVVAGDQRGRQIGFPTANMASENELIPPNGVYAAIVRQDADGAYSHATRYNFSPEWDRVSAGIRLSAGRGSVVGRVLLCGKAVQIQDVVLDPDYTAAWKLYARALLETGQPKAALDAYRQGIDVARRKGDRQAEKEMTVFARRIERALGSG